MNPTDIIGDRDNAINYELESRIVRLLVYTYHASCPFIVWSARCLQIADNVQWARGCEMVNGVHPPGRYGLQVLVDATKIHPVSIPHHSYPLIKDSKP